MPAAIQDINSCISTGLVNTIPKKRQKELIYRKHNMSYIVLSLYTRCRPSKGRRCIPDVVI